MWKDAQDHTEPIITAKAHIASAHGCSGLPPFPKTALLFYTHAGVEYLREKETCGLLCEKLPRFLQGCPVYRLNERLCFLDGGRGAPQAADTLETLAALGVEQVFSVGMCGAFSSKIRVGDVVVPNKAFVEEGTSLHYYSAIDAAQPDAGLFAALCAIPGAKAFPIVSCDAVYRQTFLKERLWREKGAVAVDMETSALFSVGKCLGVKVASVLMASDSHPLEDGETKWEWKVNGRQRQELFEKALGAILPALV